MSDQKKHKQPAVDSSSGKHVKDMKQDTLASVLQFCSLTDGERVMFSCKEMSKRWSAQFQFILTCLQRATCTFTVRHKVMCYAYGGYFSPMSDPEPVSNVTMEREGIFGPFSLDKAKQVALRIKNDTCNANAWNAWNSDNNDGYTRTFEEGDDYRWGQKEEILVETASEARPESDIEQWVAELGGAEEDQDYNFTYTR